MTKSTPQSDLDFERLFASTPAPHLVLDLDFHIVAVNDAYLEVTMTERAALLGRHIFEVFPDNPDNPEATGVANLRDNLQRVRRDQQPSAASIQRYDIRRPDGTFEERYWSQRNAPVLDNDGRLRHIVHHVKDVTDYVEARRQVEALAKQAQQESRNKDQFLAMLGHELRNPMAAISTAVHVLQSAEEDSLPAERLNWGLEIIDRQLEQLTRLVNDLLDVARINEGRIELQRDQVSVTEIVERAVEASRPLIDQRGQTLTIDLTDRQLCVWADLTRMTQVVANLLNNAAKYTQTGGDIAIRTKVVGDQQVVIEVRDNGQGIDAELLPHVFDLFKQADVSLDRAQGGLGLGLTLVKQLVEMHGGQVEARSEGRERGSTFIVQLPLSDASADPLGLTATGDNRPSVSRRILIVDDNRDAADSLAMLLRVEGHSVEVAHDGEAGLELARDFRPDVALLDIGLPVLDGYEVARRMRQMSQTRDTILVAVTGYGQESDRRFSEEAGFAYHLVKPVSHQRLRQVLSWIGDES